MAFWGSCPSCLSGNHAGHVEHWGVRPADVIDGDFCGCMGECEELVLRGIESLRPAKARMQAGKPSVVVKLGEVHGERLLATLEQRLADLVELWPEVQVARCVYRGKVLQVERIPPSGVLWTTWNGEKRRTKR